MTSLTAKPPYYIAHRGGGGDWPEMTAYAYQQAAKLPGLHALEISVCLTADNVLVCSHDPTTTRLTGQPYTIAQQTWSTLSALLVSAAATNDPAQPARPFTRLEDVLEQFSEHYVLFVEPKVTAAAAPLLQRMAQLNAPQRVVWKSYVNAAEFVTAKQHGFSTWGYVLNQPSHTGANLDRFAASPDIDRLGIAVTESDELVRAVVAAASSHGKQTIAYPITSSTSRDRSLALGVAGLMTSNVMELVPPGQ